MSRVEINTRAAELALPDFNGKLVRLADFRDRQHVLLVFNRGFG
jgi:hypothetical protein